MSGTTNSWKWVSVAAAAVLAVLVCAGTAFAAAPSATTGPTTAVGSTTATVTGTVDPGGQGTTWVVEYGTSTSYGSKTASKSAGSGTAAVDVSSALTGLHAGTTYHYRLVATNGAGTSHGTDAVFTTTVPPDVTTGGASAITASSATLNGTVDPNSRATTFYFEYGTSTSYGTKTATKSAGRLPVRNPCRPGSLACRPAASTTSASSPRATPAPPPARTPRSRRARRPRS